MASWKSLFVFLGILAATAPNAEGIQVEPATIPAVTYAQEALQEGCNNKKKADPTAITQDDGSNAGPKKSKGWGVSWASLNICAKLKTNIAARQARRAEARAAKKAAKKAERAATMANAASETAASPDSLTDAEGQASVGVIETALAKSRSAIRAFANKFLGKKSHNKNHAPKGQTPSAFTPSQAGSPRTSCAGADTTTINTTTVHAAASASPADGTDFIDNIDNPAAAASRDIRTSSGGDSATSVMAKPNIFRRAGHKVAKRASRHWGNLQKACVNISNKINDEVTFGKVSLAANNTAVQVYAASG